jgi:hypothetical protein
MKHRKAQLSPYARQVPLPSAIFFSSAADQRQTVTVQVEDGQGEERFLVSMAVIAGPGLRWTGKDNVSPSIREGPDVSTFSYIRPICSGRMGPFPYDLG